MNISRPARKYSVSCVLVQSFGEGPAAVARTPHQPAGPRASMGVARSAMPELGLCKGIAVEMEDPQKRVQAAARRRVVL